MEYIAHDPGSVFHASHGREKVESKTATGGRGWHWRAKTYCNKEVAGISGNALPSIVDCKICQQRLRAEGWDI